MNDKLRSPDPVVFLVGAGRSGTTLLYKLLCLHPDIAYVSNYDARLGALSGGRPAAWMRDRLELKRAAWFEQGGNAYFIRRPLLKRLIPTPVEGESVYETGGMPRSLASADPVDAGRLRAGFERIRRAMRARWLLSKRTANNRRIPLLERVFRQPRYIHLIRDGRDVANSLSKVEWWDGYTPWWAGRTAAEMEQAGERRLALAARNWAEEIRQLRTGLDGVPRERVFEIRYEQLLERPAERLRQALDFLGLDAGASYRQAVESLSLGYRPPAWGALWTADEMSAVMREIEPLLARLGYV
jgi:hypothetical protein